ncbi:MAG: helix-turn-helix domain-containing protein [Planctomycetes bacterium]|nr:helix-turn-helix domain-containing protein [Planctomycetota bacterium]
MNVRPTIATPEPVSYRLEDAARAVGVSARHLSDYIRTGELPASKLGTATVILRSDLIAFVRARRVVTTTGEGR